MESPDKPNLSEKTEKQSNTRKNPFFVNRPSVVRLETPIKERFRVLLSRLGRSQNWLSDQVGISSGTISRIVNGEWFPQSQVMKRIAEVLEVDSVVIFGDSKHWKVWSDKMIYDKEGDDDPK